MHQRKGLPGNLSAVLALLGILAFINYVDRGNLSIAASMLKDQLRISPAQFGVLLSAFFWSYACLQPAAGWLALTGICLGLSAIGGSTFSVALVI